MISTIIYSLIFKVFDNDIDKWTAKIGVFGKSFNELGTAINNAFNSTIDNIDNFDENISFWESLKNNLMPKDGESLFKNSLGEIISQENIDSYIKELDLDSARDELETIFEWDSKISNKQATWQDYFDTLRDGSENYIPDLIKNTDDLSKLTGNDLVKANKAARTSAIAHNQALKQQTLSAKAGQLALKGLALVGNMLAGVVLSLAISELVKGIDYLINRQEKLKESLEDSVSKFESATSEVNNLKEEIETCGEKISDLQELADNGTISVSDEKELELLKETNKELERKLALKQAEQIQAQKEVLEDNKSNINQKVYSSYAGINSNGNFKKVSVGTELELALNEYEKYSKLLLETDVNSSLYKQLENGANIATKTINKMYESISPSIDAYDKLIEAGYELTDVEKTEYDNLRRLQDGYLLYNYNLNGTKEAFQGLNTEQQRNIILNRLLEQGLSDVQAQYVMDNISDDDLSDLWGKDFSFTPPEFTDYATAEEYGKAYAEAWLNGAQEIMSQNASGQIADLWDVESFTNTIKSYEEGYSKLISAQEEWDEAQSISADTFADLQENGLLEYIEITSEGLTINKDKLLENAQATKDKAVADLHAAMMSDLLNIALGNVDSVSEEAKTVIAELGDNTEEAGKQALNSVANWGTLGATITATMAAARGEDRGFNGVSDEQRAQMDAVYNYYTDLADKIGAIDITTPTRTSGKSGSKDTYVEAFEKELKSLQILRDRGEINEKEYLDRLKVLYEKYFKDRKEYLDEFKKYETEYLEGMESLYNSAISGIAKLYDKRIDGINKVKDALEEEKDAQLEALETQIEAKQEVIDGIQDEIDKMQEANDERKRQIDLQQKQYELERLQNQRTIMTYKNGQVVYETDTREIRNAREEVADAEFEIEIANKEKQISLIEKEIELLEKQKENVEDYYTKMIEQQEKLIESIEKQKSKWEELSEVREVAEAYSAIEQVFGDLGYSVEEVLNGSTGAFEDFKSKYLTILSEMDSNSSFGNGLTYAVDELDKSLSGIGNNTQGLDNLTSKMGEVANSVENVTNAISGVGAATAVDVNTSGGSTATSTASASTGSLKSAMDSQTQSALDGIDKQVQAYAGDENSLKSAIEDVTESIGTASKEGEEADPGTLIGASQVQYNVTNSIISDEITLFNNLKESIKGCVEQLREMSALMDKTGVSGSGNWKMMGTVPIYPYASGTTRAKKGLSIVGEESPELIEDTKGNLSLATKPTLLNMKGGEKVYNGDETRSMLTPLDESSLPYAMLMKSKSLLNTGILHSVDNTLSKQLNGTMSAIKSAQPMSQNVNLTIGDIQLQGVQDVNRLATAITNQLPNTLLQTMTKRK